MGSMLPYIIIYSIHGSYGILKDFIRTFFKGFWSSFLHCFGLVPVVPSCRNPSSQDSYDAEASQNTSRPRRAWAAWRLVRRFRRFYDFLAGWWYTYPLNNIRVNWDYPIYDMDCRGKNVLKPPSSQGATLLMAYYCGMWPCVHPLFPRMVPVTASSPSCRHHFNPGLSMKTSDSSKTDRFHGNVLKICFFLMIMNVT